MLSEPALRSEFLLLTLEMAGPFDSKAMLHRTAYLAQAMSGTTQYDFKPHPYGVYSEDLDRDIENLGVVSKSVSIPYPIYTDSHCAVKLSPDGRARLAKLGNSHMPDGMVGKLTSSFLKIKSMDKYALMEAVYSEFGSKSRVDYGRVNDDLDNLLPKVGNCYKANPNHESTLVVSILEIIKECLPKLKAATELQKTVALHLANELIQRIGDVSDKLAPPVDYGAVKPKLVEISEIESCFRNYCHKKKIMKDFFKRSLDEICTKEEIERIYRAYDKAFPV